MSKKSEFVLKYADGTYHATGPASSYSMGFQTLDCVTDIDRAEKFEAYEFAVNYKNNRAHFRYLDMTIVELRHEIEIVDRGPVPVIAPDWDDFDEEDDAQVFIRRQRESAKARGRLASAP